MSGVSTSGDTAMQALMKIVADPALHQKRLQELNDAETTANAAISALSDAQQKLAHDQALVTEQRAVISKDVQDFDTTKTAILAKEQTFDDREMAAAGRETAVAKAEAELAQAKQAFDAVTKASSDDLTKRETDVVGRETAVAAKEAELTAKEKELTDKLAKLRELAA